MLSKLKLYYLNSFKTITRYMHRSKLFFQVMI